MTAPQTLGANDASPGAVNVLAALLEARTGQRIAANRMWRIDTALRPIAAERGATTIDDLVRLVLDGSSPELADRVVDALLNQETSFFRDAQAIAGAAEAIASLDRSNPRIWCAGCATGQEPLSLAMAFAERGGPLPEIVATDVSAAAIGRARTGRFSQFEIQRGLPVRQMLQWFEQDGNDWVARNDLLRRITFRRQNLVADPAPGQFDAVLCRNVLFYLAPDLRAKVLDTFAACLRPHGILMLGAGETVIGQSNRFVPSKRLRGFYEVAGPGDVPPAYAAH